MSTLAEVTEEKLVGGFFYVHILTHELNNFAASGLRPPCDIYFVK